MLLAVQVPCRGLQHDAQHLVYDIAKARPDGPRAMVLTPLELIDKIAALVTRRYLE